jgi:TRAP-type C4-dicarboxylate transport system permease small subunit
MNRHDTDAVSLAFGLVFAAFVGWWLLLRWTTITAPGPGWFVAVAMVVFGALGLIVTAVGLWRHRTASTRSDHRDRP